MKLIVLSFSFCISIAVSAQVHYVGVKGVLGITAANTQGYQYTPTISPALGIVYEYKFPSKYSLSVEFLNAGKGFRNNNVTVSDGILINDSYMIYRFHFISLPIKFGYLTQVKSGFFIRMGVVPSLLVNNTANVKGIGKYIDPYSWRAITMVSQQEIKVKEFDLSALIEFGWRIKSYENSELLLGLGFQHGLTNLIPGKGQKYRRLPKHIAVDFSLAYRRLIN